MRYDTPFEIANGSRKLTADRSSGSTEHGYAFGPFRLIPHRQLLFEDERPIRLGSRAFDILTVLVGRAGEVVGKGELMSRVWPSTTVDEINLRVNLMAVRKALGDGRPGRRYVVNSHGRGYQFVAPVEPLAPLTPAELPKLETEAAHNLPALVTRPVGRADVADALARQVSEHPLITLVGSGGIGKTTLA